MKKSIVHVGVDRKDVGVYNLKIKPRKFKNSVRVPINKIGDTTFKVDFAPPIKITIFK